MKSEAETPPPPEVEEREEDKEVKPIKQEPASASSRPPASRTLNINIVEARGLGSRDKNGGSNPFALLYDPVTHKDGKLHQKMKTKIVKKSLSPIWNAEFKIDITDETIETIVIEVFHKRQMLVGSSKKVSLGAAVIQINDLSTTIRDQWYPLYPAKNVQGRKTHSVGGDLLPVSGEVHVILNISNEGAVGDPSSIPHEEEQQEQTSKIVVTAQEKETSTSETEVIKKKGGNKDVKTRLKTLLNTSSYAQSLLDSKHPNMETSGLITSYVTISYTKDSFARYLKNELEESPDIDLFTIPFPAVITEMYPFVDHNILSPTIWAVIYNTSYYFYFFNIICDIYYFCLFIFIIFAYLFLLFLLIY